MSAISSQKVTSLPKDLRKIADELIAEKFPEEVKREQSRDTFRDRCTCGPEYAVRCVIHDTKSYDDDRHRRNFTITYDVRPWDRRRVAKVNVRHPSYNGIKEAVYTLRRENISMNNAKMVMGTREFHDLLGSPDLGREIRHVDRSRREGEEPVIAELFGMEIICHPSIQGFVIESSY